MLEEIISPHKCTEFKLPVNQKALLIWDAFRGQLTERVKEKLAALNIKCVYVPANMTHFFQPLDLTVNRCAKQRMKKEFVTYYSSAVKQQLDSGTDNEDVEVDFCLSVLKPMHAQWLVNLYNIFTSTKGAEAILKGWKKSGILGLLDGSTTLPPEDPFQQIMSSQLNMHCHCHPFY